MQIHFLRPAEDEMNAAALFYESKSPNLGKQFLNEIKSATIFIQDNPKLGKKVRGEIRRQFIKRFPFALLYKQEKQTIIIIAVMHVRRAPEYWIKRTKA